jgi:hypothetical protein
MPLTSQFSDVGCTTLEVHCRGLDWQEKSSTNQKQGRKRNHGRC